jgi:hypothetical protein
MNKSAIKLLPFITVFLFGCEMTKVTDVNIEYQGDRIVIIGFINPDDGVYVCVSSTTPPGSAEQKENIHTHDVVLYANNKPVDTLIEKQTGYFVSSKGYKPQWNIAYKLSVSAEGYPTATSSEQYIPPPVSLDSIVIKSAPVRLCYEFNNPAVSNYFNFCYRLYNKDSLLYSSMPSGKFITQSFTNSNYSVGEVWLTADSWKPNPSFDTILVDGILYSLSSDFHKFTQSLNDYNESEDSWMGYGKNVFSNIENGYGIFTGYSYTNRKILYVNKK